MIESHSRIPSPFAGKARIHHLVAAILLISTWIFWASPLSSTTSGGGDVPTIIFRNPIGFILHTAFSVIGNGQIGYNPNTQYLGSAVAAEIIKSVGLNPQVIELGFVLIATYLGSVLLWGEILRMMVLEPTDLFLVTGALTTTLMPLVAQSYWSNLLPRVGSVAVFTFITYFGLLFLASNSYRYLFVGATTLFVGSATVTDIPSSFPMFLVTAAIGLFILLDGFRMLKLRRVAIYVTGLIGLNAIWVFPFASSLLNGQQQVSVALSHSGIASAQALTKSLAQYQSVSDILSYRTSMHMLAADNSILFHLSSYLVHFGFLSYTVTALWITSLILTVSPLGWERISTRLRALVIMTAVVLSIVIALSSAGAFVGSIQLQDWLLAHVPGWVATRNFFETFSESLSLLVGLAVVLSLLVLREFFSNRVATIAAIAALLLVVPYGAQLLNGDYYHAAYFAGSGWLRPAESIPGGYNSIMNKIANTDPTPSVLEFPMLSPSWVLLSSKTTNSQNRYIGVSPLYFLDGIKSYSGIADISGTKQNLMKLLQEDFQLGDYTAISHVISTLRIDWIVVDQFHSLPPQVSSLLASPSLGLANETTRKVIKTLHGVQVLKIGDFSLFKIPGANGTAPVLLQSSVSLRRNQLLFAAVGGISRNASSCSGYQMEAYGLNLTVKVPFASRTVNCSIFLPQAYSSNWHLVLKHGNKSTSINSHLGMGFGNLFVLPQLSQGNSTIELNYSGNSIVRQGIASSFFSFGVLIMIILLRRRRGIVDPSPSRMTP
jgi:hypothetical protein